MGVIASQITNGLVQQVVYNKQQNKYQSYVLPALCEGNLHVSDGFLSQSASNVKIFSMPRARYIESICLS